MNAIQKTARAGWKVAERLAPWLWAESNVRVDGTSPFPGPYSSDTAPWTKEIQEKAADNLIRRIVVRCAAQTSKTQTALILLAYWLANDPGPIMWAMAAGDEAETFAKTRLIPTLMSCKSIRDLWPKRRQKIEEINFPNSPLIINGANSPSKLQGKPIRFAIFDEVRNWPPGALQTGLKRTEAFWNAREFIISTGDTEGDSMDREFKAGNQCHFYCPCPQCGQSQILEFKNLKWDTNDTTRPGGEWEWDVMAETIRYECPACALQIKDSFGTRRKMVLGGVWVPHNKKAPSNVVSYTWNALVAPWIPWRRIVIEFLQAKEAMANGVIDPLKTFVTETLGESWKEEVFFSSDLVPGGTYSGTDPWDLETNRFMTVDVQRDHFWFVIRAWAMTGESRLLAEGKLLTKEEILEMQKRFRVLPRSVLIDASFDPNWCYQACTTFGWTGLKGSDAKSFTHYLSATLRELRPYSTVIAADGGMGTKAQGRAGKCPVFYWSNPTVKDILARLKSGEGSPWGIMVEATEEYRKQMTAEVKKKKRNKQTGLEEYKWEKLGRRQNHLWDCECMQVVAALIQGLVTNPFTLVEDVTGPPPQPPQQAAA